MLKLRYVCTEKVDSFKSLARPYLAVSCYNPDGLANGDVGFETSEYCLAIRNALLQRSWTYDGNHVGYIGNAWASAGVPFCRVSEVPHQTARLTTRVLGGLAEKSDSSEVSESVLEEIAYLQSSSEDLRSDVETVQKLCDLHVAQGLEMQLWPYDTKYESYFAFFGAEISVLQQNLTAFFASHHLKLKKIDSQSFPRY